MVLTYFYLICWRTLIKKFKMDPTFYRKSSENFQKITFDGENLYCKVAGLQLRIPSKYASWWRRLEDLLKMSFVFVFRRRLQDVLIKTNINVLVIRLQDVFKTFSRRLAKTSSKRLQDAFKTSCKNVFKTSSRRLQDVFKTSSRHLQDLFKTFSRR